MPIKDQKRWYDSYYESQGRYSRLKHYWNLAHLKKMGFFRAAPLDSVIVDIGCGNGNMLKTLQIKGYRELHGFDIRIPESYEGEFKLKKGSMLDIPYPDEFADVLICFNVMHHLLDMEQYKLFLENCRKVIRKSGKLFFVEPQRNIFRKTQDLLVRIPVISSISPIEGQKVKLMEEKEEIERFLNLDVEALFNKQGFKIIYFRSYLKSFILHCQV